MTRFIVFSVLALVLLGGVSAVKKRWKGPSNIFHSPSNWQQGTVPCPADNVTFQSTWTPTTVYIQNDVTVRSLQLPTDGVIVLGKALKITFDADDTSCSGRNGRTAVYQGQEPGDWDNPNNWETLDSTDSRVSTKTLAATDRLPCEVDSVVFPSRSAVAVQLNHPVSVASLEIDSVSLTQTSLVNWLSTLSGRGQFRLPSTNAIKIGTPSCTSTVCPCGNTGMDIVRSACSFLGTCTAVGDCRQPVSLAGDCCAYCGALMNATTTNAFNKAVFEARVKSFIGSASYKLKIVSSKLVQVLLQSSSGSTTVVDQLTADIVNDPSRYGLAANTDLRIQKSLVPLTEEPRTIVRTVTVIPSLTNEDGVVITEEGGKPKPAGCENVGQTGASSGSGSSSSSTTPWIVAALVGLILLIVIIVILVYVITKRRVKQNAADSPKVHFVHHADGMGTSSMTDITGSGGMTNPLYATMTLNGDDIPTELPQ